MKSHDESRYRARAQILKALAHPTRLFLVDELAKGDRCVCELTALVGADMSTVSRHLAILKSVGIVSDRKQGLQVHYHLCMPCVLRMFDCIESALKQNAKAYMSLVSVK